MLNSGASPGRRLPIVEFTHRLTQARYDLGLSSIVELSQRQLALTSAPIQNANAKYNYQILRAVLDYHAGARP